MFCVRPAEDTVVVDFGPGAGIICTIYVSDYRPRLSTSIERGASVQRHYLEECRRGHLLDLTTPCRRTMACTKHDESDVRSYPLENMYTGVIRVVDAARSHYVLQYLSKMLKITRH